MSLTSAARQRAFHLLDQGRADLAEPELRRALADDPDDAHLHAALALVLTALERGDEAIPEAERAVALEPEWGFTHLAHASALLEADRLGPALKAAREALRLDPDEPAAHVKLAEVLYRKRKHTEALAAVDRALALDPEDAEATNLRAVILVRLDRREEAAAAVEGVLARAPEDSSSHANMGWTLLHQGRSREAMEAFRESLRLDPANDWARSGIVEAMKARNVAYRSLLRYFLWMDRQSAGMRWGVLIGGFLLVQAVPALLWIYLPLVLVTWIGNSLFNLVLFLDPFGRLVLSRDERRWSAVLGLCLAGGVLSLLASVGVLALRITASPVPLDSAPLSSEVLSNLGAFLLTFSVPIGGTASKPVGRRRFAGGFTVALGVLGVAALVTLASGGPWVPLANLYLYGWVAFTWLANMVKW